jgi:hypothetical protein
MKFCLYNPATGVCVTKAAQEFVPGTETSPWYFRLKPLEATRLEFKSLDEASKYAAVYGLTWAGFVPQPIVPGNRVLWAYEPCLCQQCGRKHDSPRAAIQCCRSPVARRRG